MDSAVTDQTKTVDLPSPYAIVGARLVSLGYTAIPIQPGTKRPGSYGDGQWWPMHDWTERWKDRLPSQIETRIWSAQPGQPGVCVLTGRQGLIGMDLDEDGPAADAIRAILPPTRCAKTGKKGETLFYRCADGHTILSRSYTVRGVRILDVLADGRQSVLPPTIHPDTGRPYMWTGEWRLEDLEIEDLPLIGEDIHERIVEALRPFGYEESHNPTPRLPGERSFNDGDLPPHRSLNNWALANLDSWVPLLGPSLVGLERTSRGFRCVAAHRGSNTGKSMAERGRSFAFHSDGIVDFGDGPKNYTPLNAVRLLLSVDLDQAFGWLANATGWATAMGRPELAAATTVVVPTLRIEPEAPLPPLPVVTEEDFDPTLPDELTRIPGLLGEIVDWIESCALAPSRPMALAAAVTVLGTLAGRRWSGPTVSGTHVYMIGIAPSGAGKDHPLACITRLMKAAGAGAHVGPGGFTSVGAILNVIQRMPLCVCPLDEFGQFIKKMTNKRAAGHEAEISGVLRGLWGRSFQGYMTQEYASRAAVEVFAPAVSLFGVSTVGELYAAFSESNVTDGLLNRFLTIRVSDKPRMRKVREVTHLHVPIALTENLRSFYMAKDGILVIGRLNQPDLDPDPRVVPWADDAAEAVYSELLDLIEQLVGEDAERESFLARTAEYAVRLATIRALGQVDLSEGELASVSAEDMEWGKQVALLSAQTMWGDARDLIGAGEHQTAANAILRFIRAKGGSVTKRQLHQNLGKRYAPRLFAEVMKALIEDQEYVEQGLTLPASGGHVTVTYSLRRH